MPKKCVGGKHVLFESLNEIKNGSSVGQDNDEV